MNINDCPECSPWRLCEEHYDEYQAGAPARAIERENTRAARIDHQKKVEQRKRDRKAARRSVPSFVAVTPTQEGDTK